MVDFRRLLHHGRLPTASPAGPRTWGAVCAPEPHTADAVTRAQSVRDTARSGPADRATGEDPMVPDDGVDPSAPSPRPRHPPVVLVMNHNRDPIDPLTGALAQHGYEVRLGDSLAQSHRLAGEARPDVVVLNPLVLCEGGVELELLERLQRDDDPVPVILLVDDLAALADARKLRVPFRDFVLKPGSPAEVVHRVELALQTKDRIRGLRERAQKLESQVSVDFKTGLTSDRTMRRILDREWKMAQRHQTPLSLLLIDVDNFKGVNDSTEYAFGDRVLQKVAEALKGNVRETDYAARFGGDEFCVLLPQTSPAEAVQTALRIRQRISGMVVNGGGYQRQVTVSIGVDSYDGRKVSSVDQLRRNANRALQEAKRRGKNQVWLYSGAEPGGAADGDSFGAVGGPDDGEAGGSSE